MKAKYCRPVISSVWATSDYDQKPVAVLSGWHGVAEATPKKPRATPQATPNENMNFGTQFTLCIYKNFW